MAFKWVHIPSECFSTIESDTGVYAHSSLSCILGETEMRRIMISAVSVRSESEDLTEYNNLELFINRRRFCEQQFQPNFNIGWKYSEDWSSFPVVLKCDCYSDIIFSFVSEKKNYVPNTFILSLWISDTDIPEKVAIESSAVLSNQAKLSVQCVLVCRNHDESDTEIMRDFENSSSRPRVVRSQTDCVMLWVEPIGEYYFEYSGDRPRYVTYLNYLPWELPN